MAAGSRRSVHDTALQGDPAKWDRAAEIRWCSPLMWSFPENRRKLLDNRDEARRDARLKPRFLSYGVKAPTPDESTMLLAVHDWQRVCGRPVPAPEGQRVIGLDLGGVRGWPGGRGRLADGRTEVVTVAPGRPSARGSGAARPRPSAGRTDGWSSRTGCGLPKGAASKPPASCWSSPGRGRLSSSRATSVDAAGGRLSRG